MEILVTGSSPKRADASWTAIQRMIGVLVGEPDGRLTRIIRPDGGCDYRTHGVYELTYTVDKPGSALSAHIRLELR